MHIPRTHIKSETDCKDRLTKRIFVELDTIIAFTIRRYRQLFEK